MSSFKLRPKFEIEIEKEPEEIVNILKERLQSPKAYCTGTIARNFIVLKILPDERHYWSPQLSILLDEIHDGKGHTSVRGRYGPQASVWAVFAYSYAAIAILVTFIGIIGSSQYMLGENALILWAIPVLLIVAAALYLIAQTGQKVGAEQTFTLHHFLEDSLDMRIHLH